MFVEQIDGLGPEFAAAGGNVHASHVVRNRADGPSHEGDVGQGVFERDEEDNAQNAEQKEFPVAGDDLAPFHRKQIADDDGHEEKEDMPAFRREKHGDAQKCEEQELDQRQGGPPAHGGGQRENAACDVAGAEKPGLVEKPQTKRVEARRTTEEKVLGKKDRTALKSGLEKKARKMPMAKNTPQTTVAAKAGW